jgi:hypothetical protein
MGAFRRVEPEQAGPGALGILVPPGKRTFVILRPRALPWDLLVLRDPEGPAFHDLAHDEATFAAQTLYRALCEWAGGGPGLVEALPDPAGFRLRATVGPFALLACPRRPGRPYEPLVCPPAEANAAVRDLTAALRPEGPAEQEVYFNSRHFERNVPA